MLKSGILVLGSGELGMSITKALSSHPSIQASSTKISVLLRRATIGSTDSKISMLKGLGVRLLPADLSTSAEEDLVKMFSPFHTIIAANGASTSSNLLKVVDAVLAAKTPLFFPWQFGVDYDIVGLGSAAQIWDVQYRVRQRLRAQSSTKWVIVSTGLFMSMLFMPAFGIVEPMDSSVVAVRALGSWDTKVTITDVDDIGRCTAAIYAQAVDDGVYDSGRIEYLAGESLSYGQIANRVESAARGAGKSIRREVWKLDDLTKIIEAGDADDVIRYRAAFGSGKGTSWDVEKTWNMQNGMKMLGVEDYAKALFRKENT